MRLVGFALLLLAACANAQVPRREGAYRSADGKVAAWRIDDRHSLQWAGARYAPVGVRVDGSVAAIDAANEAGIKDLLIDLGRQTDEWRSPIAAAEANGQRYLVRVASPAPYASGVTIDPAAYRVAGLSGPRRIDVALPNATGALVVVALKRDASILQSEFVPTQNGRLVYDLKVQPEVETVVLLYPKMVLADTLDFWEGLDLHRDALLLKLQAAKFGTGLRGVVDPFGSEAPFPEREIHGIPTSSAFQAELAALLERKHTTIEGAMSAWSLSASVLSAKEGDEASTSPNLSSKQRFLALAHLVPLWSGTRGVSSMWDPQSGRLYACDSRKSRAWEDIGEAIAQAAQRRSHRLCTAIRQVVDVPIVQEWNGWSGVTEERVPAFDGIVARIESGSPSEIRQSAARAVSTVARWDAPGWLVAESVPAGNGSLQAVIDDLAGMGFATEFAEPPLSAVAPVAKLRVQSPPPSDPIAAVFYPENATNPAAVQRLPGGRWWLPTPEDGNRLDLGDYFYGYRTATPNGPRILLWAKSPGRYLLRMNRPEAAVVTTLDGSDAEPKKAKNGLNVTIGEVPIAIDGLDELPVPDVAFKETLDRFMALSAVAERERRGFTEERMAFGQAVQAADANPGGSFTQMRLQLRRLASRLSPVTWIEAESSPTNTFSEVAPAPGASNDQALVLRALVPPAEGFVASYSVPVNNREPVEMWVAARLDPAHRGDIEAAVGGQTLIASEPPISGYGAGFAWYHLGTTRLNGNVAKFDLRMRSNVGTTAAIDAIVFAPASWRPNGLTYPYDLATPASPAKP